MGKRPAHDPPIPFIPCIFSLDRYTIFYRRKRRILWMIIETAFRYLVKSHASHQVQMSVLWNDPATCQSLACRRHDQMPKMRHGHAGPGSQGFGGLAGPGSHSSQARADGASPANGPAARCI
jgi:hypothetical protein